MAKELKKETSTLSSKNTPKEQKVNFVFNKQKYIIMLIGLAIICAGFLLMIGGGSEDPNVFSEDLFSFRRITLSPILIVAGFIIEVYAIMKKPKMDDITTETSKPE